MNVLYRIVPAILLYSTALSVYGQISTSDLTVQTPADLVDILIGGDNPPTVSNITFQGDVSAGGTFTGGAGIVGIDSGVIFSSGRISSILGPNTSEDTSNSFGTAGDPDLASISAVSIYDAAVLEFDLECSVGNFLVLRYVFSSDEYNEYANSIYNDSFGVFLNSTNIALLPDLVTPVSLNTVNLVNNSAFYINNSCGSSGCPLNVEADGLTTVLQSYSMLNPGLNHLKLAIGDGYDNSYNSWFFLEGNSLSCVDDSDGDDIPDSVDICPFDPDNDGDGDGVCGDIDNCPAISNSDQSDSDGDGIGDVCDVCPLGGDDADGDGVCSVLDNCPNVPNSAQGDADGDGIGDACDACATDINNDADGDGVCGDLDVCPGTVIPESVPLVRLGTNRFALINNDGIFDTTLPNGNGPGRSYTITDTLGCSCAQIIEELDLGDGHSKFGCSISAMDDWVDLVQQ